MRDIAALLKTTGRYYRGLALLILNALIIFAGLELASRAAFAVRDFLPREDMLQDPRAASSITQLKSGHISIGRNLFRAGRPIIAPTQFGEGRLSKVKR